MKYMLAFLPLVGVVQAALLLGWTALSGCLAVNGVLFAAVAALIPLLVTGGIHMDGLCDTADALASHQTREKKLEILKDSHTGAFAVIGCCAYLLLTFALWTQPEGTQRWLAAETAAVGAVLSRAISAFAVVSIPCAKNSGLVHAFSSAAQKSRGPRGGGCFSAALRCPAFVAQPAAGRVRPGGVWAASDLLLSNDPEAVWRHHRRSWQDTWCR